MARRYNTDPGEILQWDPDRVAMAVACFDQAMATAVEKMERKEAGFPVFVLGHL